MGSIKQLLFTVLFITLVVGVLFALGEEVKRTVLFCIAGWQVGSWSTDLYRWLVGHE